MKLLVEETDSFLNEEADKAYEHLVSNVISTKFMYMSKLGHREFHKACRRQFKQELLKANNKRFNN